MATPQVAGGAAVTVVPAHRAAWEDLQTVFGNRGAAVRCQCQRYKLRPRESFAAFPVEERQHRLRMQTEAGRPDASGTSGLVAYLGAEPAGWAAVEPRSAFPGLHHSPVPWAGRDEDPADSSVWAVTCLFTRAGYRRRGISRALLQHAVAYARENGAGALEGYPMITTATIMKELHVGIADTFRAAGFSEVAHPTKRRVVMRIDFS